MEVRQLHTRTISAAGRFYPADKVSLERELSLLLEASPVFNLTRPVRAIIVPHDSLTLSGGVAARAFRQIIDISYRRAVFITTAHQERFPFISVYSGDGYRTPLGCAPVDQQHARLVSSLHSQIQLSEKGHLNNEHALETILPFLQWTHGNIPILPIVFGTENETLRGILWKILYKTLPLDETLFVATTNLSHRHTYSEAKAMDQMAINDIEIFDESRLLEDVAEKRVEMCSPASVYTVMKIGRVSGADKSKVLLYRNSYDMTGSRDEVSGYLAAVIY